MSRLQSSGLNAVWESDARYASWSVSFPNTPDIELLLLSAELFQAADSHEIAFFEFKGRPIWDSTIITSNDPVIFTYSSGSSTAVMHGYVYDVRPVSGTQVHLTRMTVIGASHKLKNTDQKIYKNTTADGVIAKIAAKYGMTSLTQRHPRLRDAIVQAGQSDWQLCRRLAKQCGFAFRAENTTLIFMSKDKIFSDKKGTAPWFLYSDGFSVAERMWGTCFHFSVEVSDENPDLGANVYRTVTGVNSASGDELAASHPPTNFTAPASAAAVPNPGFFL